MQEKYYQLHCNQQYFSFFPSKKLNKIGRHFQFSSITKAIFRVAILLYLFALQTLTRNLKAFKDTKKPIFAKDPVRCQTSKEHRCLFVCLRFGDSALPFTGRLIFQFPLRI